MRIMRVLILGDSIVEWIGDSEMGGWVNRLKIDCLSSFPDMEITNCWVGWNTSRDLIKTTSHFLHAYLDKYNEDTYIFISVWVNDSYLLHWDKDGKNIGKDEYKNNIESLVHLLKKDNRIKKIFILWLTPVIEKFTTPIGEKNIFYTNEQIQAYDEILKKIATDESVDYIDIVNNFDEHDFIDWLHPNQYGHFKIFRDVKRYLSLHL
jgi:lysophospholipase L1-like esterase